MDLTTSEPTTADRASRYLDQAAKLLPLLAVALGAILICGWIPREVGFSQIGIVGVQSDKEVLLTLGAVVLLSLAWPLRLLLIAHSRRPLLLELASSTPFLTASIMTVGITAIGLRQPESLLRAWGALYSIALGYAIAWWPLVWVVRTVGKRLASPMLARAEELRETITELMQDIEHIEGEVRGFKNDLKPTLAKLEEVKSSGRLEQAQVEQLAVIQAKLVHIDSDLPGDEAEIAKQQHRGAELARENEEQIARISQIAQRRFDPTDIAAQCVLTIFVLLTQFGTGIVPNLSQSFGGMAPRPL